MPYRMYVERLIALVAVAILNAAMGDDDKPAFTLNFAKFNSGQDCFGMRKIDLNNSEGLRNEEIRWMLNAQGRLKPGLQRAGNPDLETLAIQSSL
jgi:hypothetical protein